MGLVWRKDERVAIGGVELVFSDEKLFMLQQSYNDKKKNRYVY